MPSPRRSSLTALVRRSLALPGALVDAVRGLGAPRAVVAAPGPAPGPAPMLERLRAIVGRVTGESPGEVPLATWSEVRVYRTPGGRAHDGSAHDPRDVADAIEVAPRRPDALDLEVAEARARLRPLIGELRLVARDLSQAIALRIDRQLAEVEEAVGRLELPRGRRRRLELTALLREALGEARLLRVEVVPAQGRRRDLKRITALGRRLAGLARSGRRRR